MYRCIECASAIFATVIRPLVNLMARFSTGPNAPGDVLETRLSGIEVKLNRIENACGARGTTSSPGSPPDPLITGLPPGWGPGVGTTSSAATPPSADSSTASVAELIAQVNALRQDLTEVQGQLENQAVQIEGETFKSLKAGEAWLTRNGVTSEQIWLLLDPISMIQMSDSVSPDEASASAGRIASAKIGDPSPEWTKYMATFSMEIPTIFGKGKDATKSIVRAGSLPAVPSYDEWNNSTGRNGVKDRLKEVLAAANALSCIISKTGAAPVQESTPRFRL